MNSQFRVLIVGGYGVFGGRLVELLEDEPRLTLIVAGRSSTLARQYCAGRTNAAATLVAAVFDRTSDDLKQLTAFSPTLVVDASGPFQSYGSHPYRLVEQCIKARINYLDLADGSKFVTGIGQFDAAARSAGVYVFSGVSSYPVLTAAVVRRLATGAAKVCSIRGGIAPSPFAGVGLNVIRAIASYSGQRIRRRRRGRVEDGYPFTESERFVIAVPGRIPLERRRFSLVDVPDLLAMEALWPEVQEVWMGAAPVPAALHAALTAFAWLVRIRLLPNITWMASAMHFVTNHVRWGEHRGGMFVVVQGETANGEPLVREWHLLAEANDGPLIPCMAMEAIIRKCLSGHRPAVGARTAIADVELSDYEALFSRRTIYTGIRERLPVAQVPLYQQILGTSWAQLAPQITQLHCVTGVSRYGGRCTVNRGRNLLSWLLAELIGFPKTGTERSMTVTLSLDAAGERWVRSCEGRTFSSVQYRGRGSSQWLVRERFGPVSVDMGLAVEGVNLRYRIRRWALLGCPLPLWLGPRSSAIESVRDGKFRFDVEISHLFTGLVVRYAGMLAPIQ